MSDDSEYKALDSDISAVESAIKGTSDTSSMFSHLRDWISAFLKRQKEMSSIDSITQISVLA